MSSIDKKRVQEIANNFKQIADRGHRSQTYLDNIYRVVQLDKRSQKTSFGDLIGKIDNILDHRTNFTATELEWVQRGFKQINSRKRPKNYTRPYSLKKMTSIKLC